jgi:hypothetical protein
MGGFKFYLGIHHGHWLRTVPVPVCISHSVLRTYKRAVPERLPDSAWILDSGAFSEIDANGRWTTTPEQYVADSRRYVEQVGSRPDFVAPMDWMCEPKMIAKTGLSVREHQHRTVESVQALRALAPDLPVAPVIQGWDLDSYIECVGLYDEAHINLKAEPAVGLGSVCKRQHTDEIGRIVTTLVDEFGLENLHGFGVKSQGIAKYGASLASSDSLAWSTDGRWTPGCVHGTRGKTEANCIQFGLEWRERMLRNLNPWRQTGLAVFA